MAILAIEGHKERGEEVIKILEMLGAENNYNFKGNNYYFVYYANNREIFNKHQSLVDDAICFTIEEFLEKFPYKVGDKVLYKIYNVYSSIKTMIWNEEKEQVIYRLDSHNLWIATADELEPYKELIAIKENSFENLQTEGVLVKAEKTITTEEFYHNSKEWIIDRLACMSANDALHNISNLYDELHRPKFPNTYEDCCKVLNIIPNNKLVFSNPNEESEYAYRNLALYNDLDKLKVCRDAYWKIAWDWKPDVMYCDLYCIGYDGNVITWKMQGGCRLLVFPTAEMRDAFYENFKELIEECKELL